MGGGDRLLPHAAHLRSGRPARRRPRPGLRILRPVERLQDHRRLPVRPSGHRADLGADEAHPSGVLSGADRVAVGTEHVSRRRVRSEQRADRVLAGGNHQPRVRRVDRAQPPRERPDRGRVRRRLFVSQVIAPGRRRLLDQTDQVPSQRRIGASARLGESWVRRAKRPMAPPGAVLHRPDQLHPQASGLIHIAAQLPGVGIKHGVVQHDLEPTRGDLREPPEAPVR